MPFRDPQDVFGMQECPLPKSSALLLNVLLCQTFSTTKAYSHMETADFCQLVLTAKNLNADQAWGMTPRAKLQMAMRILEERKKPRDAGARVVKLCARPVIDLITDSD